MRARTRCRFEGWTRHFMLALVMVVVFQVPAAAGKTGDFTCLQNGNVWRFKGTYSVGSLYYPGRLDSMLRTISVVGERPSGSGTLYNVVFRDSLYARKDQRQNGMSYPDTVVVDSGTLIDSGSGIGIHSGFTSDFDDWDGPDVWFSPGHLARPLWFFTKPSSRDESMDGILTVAGRDHVLDSVTIGFQASYSGSRLLAQDFGVFRLHGNFFVGTNTSPNAFWELQLIQFNGISLETYSVGIHLLEAERRGLIGNSAGIGMQGWITGQRRNLLGRWTPDPGSGRNRLQSHPPGR